MSRGESPNCLEYGDLPIEGAEDLAVCPWNGPWGRESRSPAEDVESGVNPLEGGCLTIEGSEDLTVRAWRTAHHVGGTASPAKPRPQVQISSPGFVRSPLEPSRSHLSPPELARSPATVRIYIGNLDYAVTSEELRALFEQFGVVNSAEVQVKARTGQSRGFGLVEMSRAREAETAIVTLNGREFRGRPLTVIESRPRRTIRSQNKHA